MSYLLLCSLSTECGSINWEYIRRMCARVAVGAFLMARSHWREARSRQAKLAKNVVIILVGGPKHAADAASQRDLFIHSMRQTTEPFLYTNSSCVVLSLSALPFKRMVGISCIQYLSDLMFHFVFFLVLLPTLSDGMTRKKNSAHWN